MNPPDSLISARRFEWPKPCRIGAGPARGREHEVNRALVRISRDLSPSKRRRLLLLRSQRCLRSFSVARLVRIMSARTAEAPGRLQRIGKDWKTAQPSDQLAQGQVVGSLSGPSAQCPRRADQRLESKSESMPRHNFSQARAASNLPVELLSDCDRQRFRRPLSTIAQSPAVHWRDLDNLIIPIFFPVDASYEA